MGTGGVAEEEALAGGEGIEGEGDSGGVSEAEEGSINGGRMVHVEFVRRSMYGVGGWEKMNGCYWSSSYLHAEIPIGIDCAEAAPEDTLLHVHYLTGTVEATSFVVHKSPNTSSECYRIVRILVVSALAPCIPPSPCDCYDPELASLTPAST